MMTPSCRLVTGGVDTHAEFHVAVVLDSATGERLGDESFPATSCGYVELAEWLKSFGAIDAVGVEGTGTWGAGLASHLGGIDIAVFEVDRPDRKTRRFDGKSDPIDADAAARAVLSG